MPLTHLNDFSDKLSPMLVKELRQGMRARGFTMLFLIFQGLLAFILLTAGSVSSMDNAGSFASGVIFTLFIFAALVIQPMRGANSLSAEVTANTIEMMALTRLTAWRIVFGKWIAIISQTALILITIIPYLILRYFFGGMVMLGEMVFLALIFLTSMSLTAVNVGLSGNKTKLFRILPLFFFIFLMNIGPRFLFRGGFDSFMDYCTLSDWQSRAVIGSYVCFVTYIGWCALSLGTSSIAPAAENHATVRRLVALGLTLLTAAVGFHSAVDIHVTLFAFGIILTPAIITAITEPAVLLPPICKPFLKRGLAGRVVSIFLLPGWPAGVFYSILLLAIMAGTVTGIGISRSHSSMDTESLVISLALIGGVLLSALLAANFSKQEDKRFTNFVVFMLSLVVITVIPSILTNINHQESYLWLFAWNPFTFITMINDRAFVDQHLLLAVTAVDAIIVILLLISAAIAFRRYRDIFKEAEDTLALEEAPAPSPVIS